MLNKERKFYKKLTVANLLNWFAMRLYRLSNKFCSKLILTAVSLDPSRNIFRKNLLTLNSPNKPFIKTLKSSVLFYSITEGCKKLSKNINFFDVNQTVKLSLPQVINPDVHLSEKYICEANLPDSYLALLDDTVIFAGTDLVLAQGIALYDEIDSKKANFYAIKSSIIEKITLNKIVINIPVYEKEIECGIHFAKDHSKNYFHWIIECLPRLSLIEGLDNNIPLLIDQDLSPQSIEALKLLNMSSNRPLIKLERNICYKVKKLYYPSPLSIIHDNYKLPLYHRDVIYSPKAINFVRNSVLQNLNIKSQPLNRKLYISRKHSDYRQLLNSTEIENLLVTHGFEIVFPENLTFFTQVQIFSEAKVIIGQSGAGMANFIFAPKGCKVLMMVSDVPQTNLHLFFGIAPIVGINLEFLIGKHVYKPQKYTIHADFYVDTKLLIKYLDQL